MEKAVAAQVDASERGHVRSHAGALAKPAKASPSASSRARRERPSSSLSRTFALLDLFTPERMVWSAEAMIDHCGYSRPTGYRYIRELVETGLLVRFGDGFYSLGPRVVELDLLIRQADPLLSAGLPIIREIVARTGVDINLIRRYDERIVTIHQESGGDRLLISFGRGRQLPPLRGAGSKGDHRASAARTPEAHLRERSGIGRAGRLWRELARIPQYDERHSPCRLCHVLWRIG